MASKRPKQVYREGYEPGSMMVSKHLLPERLPYMAKGWMVDAMEVMAAGELDDGREFQEVRVYAREASGPAPCPGGGREVSALLASAECLACGLFFRQKDGAPSPSKINTWVLPEHFPVAEVPRGDD